MRDHDAVQPPDADDFQSIAQMWALTKTRADLLTAQVNQLRDKMSKTLRARGITDEKGSYLLPLNTAVNVGEKVYSHVKLERAEGNEVDEEQASLICMSDKIAERAAQRKTDRVDVYNRVFPWVRQFDPQETYVLYQEGILDDEDLDAIFPPKVAWRFKGVA